MVNIRKFLTGLGLIPVSSTSIDTKGEMEVLSSDGRVYWHDGSAVQKVTGNATTDTLTNKSISGATNTLSAIPASAVSSGQVAVANGGTGVATLTAHGVVIGEGTSAVAVTSAGTTGQALVSGGASADPAFATLGVVGGGTGAVTLTNHGVVVGQGTSAVAVTAAGSAGQPLLSGGASADPSYGTLAIANGGTGQTAKAGAFDALSPMSASGDIIYGGASGTGTRLAKGSDTQVLTLASGLPTWAAAGTASPLTTKGDLYGFSTVNARLPVGTNGQSVLADSAQTLGVKWGLPSNIRTINAQTGTTYTFVLSDGSDAGGEPLITASNASAQTYTVPTNASVAFPVGTQIDITQIGAGLVTLAAAGGVTLNSLSSGLSMLGQYSSASLVKTATNTWQVYGTGINSSLMSLSDLTAYTQAVTASTSSPTKGTTSLDSAQYSRVGDKIYLQYNYIQTAAGSAGSGIYMYTLPAGLNFDTNKLTVNTISGNVVGYGKIANSTDEVTSASSVSLIAYDSTHFSLMINNGAGVNFQFQSGGAFNYGNTNLLISFFLTAPISGWTSTSSGTVTAPRSEIILDTPNGHGSTNTKMRRWTNTRKSVGTAITYADSSTLGASFTINETGIFSITYSDRFSSGGFNVGITVNDSATTTSVFSTTYAQGRRAQNAGSSADSEVSWTGNLSAGDIIYTKDNGTCDETTDRGMVTIVKVSN